MSVFRQSERFTLIKVVPQVISCPCIFTRAAFLLYRRFQEDFKIISGRYDEGLKPKEDTFMEKAKRNRGYYERTYKID